MQKSKLLSIILVNYNSKQCLKKCLASIRDNLGENNFEIVIVNNDKNEALDEIRKTFPETKIVDHRENIGFGAGHNLGIRSASGEFLLLLNPDTEIISKNVGKVIEKFEKNEKIGVIGGGIMNFDGSCQKWSAGFETSLLDLALNNLGLSKSKKIWQKRIEREVDWVSGTAFFVRRSLFEKLDGFDENFFMYFEDMDFCARARKIGQKTLYYPDFKVNHKSGASYNGRGNIQKKHYYNSQEHYFEKHFSKFHSWLLKLIRRVLLK